MSRLKSENFNQPLLQALQHFLQHAQLKTVENHWNSRRDGLR